MARQVNEKIDRLRIEGQTVGVTEAARELDGLAQAHGRAGAAAIEGGKAHEVAGRSLRNVNAAFEDLRARQQGAPAAWRRMAADLRLVGRAAEETAADQRELRAATDATLRAFASRVAPNLSPTIDLEPFRKALAMSKTIDDQLRGTLHGMFKDAERAEMAVREQAKATEDLAARARQMRDAMDPLAAAQRKMNEGIAEAQALRAAQVATDAEVVQRTRQLREEFDRVADSQKALAGREAEQAAKQQAKALEDLASRAQRMREEIDPLAAAQRKMNEGIAEAQALRAAHVVTDDEVIQRTRQLHEEFDRTSRTLVTANDNIRLTNHQMTNLGYQTNDILTMWAMGASPFQIISSQAGQVVQALGDGPGGVKGSLVAIGSSIAGFARAIPTAAYAVAGVTAAVGALWYMTSGPKARTAEESLNTYEEAVKRLGEGWRGAGQAAEEYFARTRSQDNANRPAAMLDAQARYEQLRKDYEAAIKAWGSADGLDENIIRARVGRVPEARQEIAQLYTDLIRGKGGAADFAEEMLRIRLDPSVEGWVRRLAGQIFNARNEAIDLQRQMEALRAGADMATSRGARVTTSPNDRTPLDLRDRFGGGGNLVARLDPEGHAALTAQLRAQRGELQGLVDAADDARRALANFDLSPVQRQIAETTQEYDRRIAAYKRSTDDTIGLAALQEEKEAALALVTKEATRAEEARRAGYALDLRSVGDITAAQRAATAWQRAYNDAVAEGHLDSYARARADEASALTMAQARQQLTDGIRSQTEATQAQIAQLQLEYDLVGRSAGEVARLQAEFQMLAQAKEAARSAGFDDATVSLTDEMRRQAAEIGRLTEATQRLNFERDLLFDREQATRSPQEQRIASQLRDMGVEYGSAQGRMDAAQLRLNERLHETNDLMWEMRDATRDAFADLVMGAGKGKDALQSLLGVFGQIGQRWASAGFDRLFGGAFNMTPGAVNSAGTIASGLAGGIAPAARAIASLPASVPTPTPAMRESSMRLAEGVTKSVSDTLLRNMLSAGKSDSHVTGLNREFATALTNMFSSAPDAVRSAVSIYSGFRSVERQAELFSAAVKKYGSESAARKWVAPPGRSQHNTGMAVDLGYGNTAARQWVHENAGAFGLKFPMSWENWHIELANGRGRGGAAPASPVTRREISAGFVDGLKTHQDRYGGASGAPSAVPIPTARPGTAGGAGLAGGFGQTAMGVIGAGLGLFGQGYQSGNPMMGGLSGALGGFQAGASLFPALGAAGPIGAVLGAGLGILGGIFGGRAQRKQEHQQKAQAWEQMRPQYEAFDASFGPAKGGLRSWITEQWGQLSGFMNTGGQAWKMGTGNSTAQFASTGTKMFQEFARKMEEVREGLPDMIGDLLSGEGIGGAFAKARQNAKDLTKQFEATLDDVAIAFGSADIGIPTSAAWVENAKRMEEERNEALAKTSRALGEHALNLLHSTVQMTDAERAMDSARGLAAGLQKTLTELGWSAEEAAADISERLLRSLADVREGLERENSDRIADLEGKGHLAEVRNFLDAFEDIRRNFTVAGADLSQLDRRFQLELQAIVDNGEIAGSAFDELIARFPQLVGIVQAYGEVVSATADEIASAVKSYEDRLFDAQNAGNEIAAFERRAARERIEAARYGTEAVAAIERTHAAERATIVLAAARTALDRSYQAEVERINSLLEKRREEASGLEDTISKLKGFLEQLTEFRKGLLLDDNLSTLGPGARLAEARKQFDDLARRAAAGDEDAQAKLTGAGQELLTEARDFYASSQGYYDTFAHVSRVLENAERTAGSQLSEAQRQLAAIEKQIALDEAQLDILELQYEKLTGIHEGILSIGAAMTAFAVASLAAKDQGVPAPGQPSAATPPSERTLAYLANNPDVLRGIQNGQTFGLGPNATVEAIAQQHWNLHGKNELSNPDRKAYARGGLIVGPGSGTSDSVPIRASNGEFMVRQAAVAAVGVDNLERINRTGLLPDPYPTSRGVPAPAADMSVAAEIRALRSEMRSEIGRLAGMIVGSDGETRALLALANAIAKRTQTALEREL